MRVQMDTTHGYQVWASYRPFLETPDNLTLMASFMYMQEALDYVHDGVRRGCSCLVLRMQNYDRTWYGSIYPKGE